ncbi:type II toxin-antitoxin system VapC family toxin [Verrucomicrobiota bacterium]
MNTVYIETSVVGAYFDDREDVVSVAQRHWTRRWWDEERQKYEIVCSEAVLSELGHSDYPHSDEALDLIDDTRRLDIDEAVGDIAKVYISRGIMPQDPVGDALHLALCSFHKCDYLLTWNCRHIANPNKFERIRLINSTLGLFVPTLVTPNQLVGEDDD